MDNYNNVFQPELTPELTAELNGLFELAVSQLANEMEADAAPIDIDRYARERVFVFVHNYLEELTCTDF